MSGPETYFNSSGLSRAQSAANRLGDKVGSDAATRIGTDLAHDQAIRSKVNAALYSKHIEP